MPSSRAGQTRKGRTPRTTLGTEDVSKMSFGKLFQRHKGKVSDKWEHFLSIYEMELGAAASLGDPLRVLEIGVQNGGSLEVWEKFLPPGSSIVGIDVNPNCRQLAFEGNIEFHVLDAADPNALEQLLGERRFDIIVDDGSHLQSDIVSTFRALYSRLEYGGKYFIEDVHTSYWASYGGGYLKPDSAIEYFKGLVDALNVDHFEGAVRLSGYATSEFLDFNSKTARLAFYDSMVVVEKYARKKTRAFRQLITGKNMRITSLLSYLDVMIAAPTRIEMVGPIKNDALHACVDELRAAREELAQLKIDLNPAASVDIAESSTEFGALSELQELKTQLHERNVQPEKRESELEELKSQLAERNVELEKREWQFEELKTQLEVRDGRIRDLEPFVAYGAEVELMKSRISEIENSRDQAISYLQSQRSESEEQLAKLMKLADLPAHIDTLTGEVRRLQGLLLERDMQMERLGTETHIKSTERDRYGMVLAQRDMRIAELEEDSNTKSLRLDRLESELLTCEAGNEQLRGALDLKDAEFKEQLVKLAHRDLHILEQRQASGAVAIEISRIQTDLGARDARIAALEPLTTLTAELAGRLKESEESEAVLQLKVDTLQTVSAKFEVQLHLVEELRREIAVLSEREQVLGQVIDMQNATRRRLQETWIYKLDGALTKRVNWSAFGLVQRDALLLPFKETRP